MLSHNVAQLNEFVASIVFLRTTLLSHDRILIMHFLDAVRVILFDAQLQVINFLSSLYLQVHSWSSSFASFP